MFFTARRGGGGLGLFCTLVNHKTKGQALSICVGTVKRIYIFLALLKKASQNIGEDSTLRGKKSCSVWGFKLIPKNCILTWRVW